MITIKVDFNSRTVDDLVWLSTRVAIASIRNRLIKEGDIVLLSDDELTVEAVIVNKDGRFFAKPNWLTKLDIIEVT